MPNHRAVAIANEFLSRRADEAWPQQMYIQKLVHIANGWNLAVNGYPLVDELPQAWDNGPVFRSIWDHIKEYGFRGKHNTLVDPEKKTVISEELTDNERRIIDHVWAKYGHLSGGQLSKLTHEPDTPWERAYFGRGRNSRLDPEDIRNHYIDLALAGRGSAA
ncbi:Panacea domain-containing protein [Oricola sp.]|uniref:Panacea domain-containing protein n=1 Tax=Oricola sp. TaxID=1979950 RepID=UPI0025CC9E36|nr:Panacea domain-containing protein [Oricola sp.]MCI5075253.1 Panacea domain-containing protein [Oricola sp.]